MKKLYFFSLLLSLVFINISAWECYLYGVPTTELSKVSDTYTGAFTLIGKYDSPSSHCKITDSKAVDLARTNSNLVPVHSCGPITRLFGACPNRFNWVEKVQEIKNIVENKLAEVETDVKDDVKKFENKFSNDKGVQPPAQEKIVDKLSGDQPSRQEQVDRIQEYLKTTGDLD